MVQLQNPDRLNQTIEFGTIDDTDVDVNGVLKNTFKQIGHPTLCGRWSLTTAQMLQVGLQQTATVIVVCHHRRSWKDITHAEYNGDIYSVSNINQDPYRNATAYDLITLTKVSDRSG